jgi:hypothetical protein
MRRRAGLHHHQAHRAIVQPALELPTREPRPLGHLPALIGSRQLEDVLGKINGNGSSIHVDSSPLDLAEMTSSQLGTSMPLKEREESIPSLVTDAEPGRWALQGGRGMAWVLPTRDAA